MSIEKSIVDNKALGRLFLQIRKSVPQNKIVIGGFGMLIILLQISVTFQESTVKLISQEGQYLSDGITKIKVLHTDSLLLTAITAIDILQFFRGNNYLVYLFTQLFTLIFLTTLLLFILKFAVISNHFGWDEKITDNLLFKIFSLFIVMYEIPFLILNILNVKVMFCRDITIFEVSSSMVYNMDLAITESVTKTEESTKSVSLVNDNLICGSSGYFTLITINYLLLFVNFTIRNISDRIQTFIPEKGFRMTKIGGYENLSSCMVVLVMLSQGSMVHFFKDNTEVRIIALYLIIIPYSILYCVNQINIPYLRKEMHLIKSFQTLIIICLLVLLAVVIESKGALFSSEFSFYITFSIFTGLALKLSNNFDEKQRDNIFSNTLDKNAKTLHTRDIMVLYASVIDYIDKTIDKKVRATRFTKEDERMNIFLQKHLVDHIRTCTRAKCYCMLDEDYRKGLHFSFFDYSLKNTLILEIVLLFEEYFLEIYNLVGENNKLVKLCTVNFLTNYTGKLWLGYSLLLRKKSKHLKNGKNSSLSIEEYSLFFRILEYNKKNLKFGMLGLFHQVELFNECSEIGSDLDIIRHSKFINSFVKFKNLILENLKTQRDFLTGLHERGNLNEAYLVSVTYYSRIRKIERLYMLLSNQVDQEYAPLLLLYGTFLFYIYQNKSKSRKILYEFRSKKECFNLNKYFAKNNIRELDSAIVYVQVGELNNNKIVYSTASFLPLLGWGSCDLLGNPIEAVVPNPIKKIHHKLFSAEVLSGKMLMKKSLRSLYVECKNGYIKKTKIGIRLNHNINNGLEFIGSLNFDRGIDTDMILLLDKDGNICAITSNLSEHCHRKKNNIADLNGELLDSLIEMNKIVELKIKTQSSAEKLKEIVKDDLLEASSIYFTKKNFFTMNLLMPKDSRIYSAIMRFEEYIVESTHEFFWSIIIVDLGQNHDLFREGRIAEFGHRYQMQENEKEVFELVHNTYRKERNLNYSLQESLNSVSEEPNLELYRPEWRDLAIKSKRDLDKNRALEKRKGIGRREIRGFLRLITKSEAPSNFSIRNVQIDTLKGFEENSFDHKVNAEDAIFGMNSQTSASSLGGSLYNQHKIGYMIHTYIKPKKIHCQPLLLLLFGILMACIHSLSLEIKTPFQTFTNSEIRDQTPTLDLFAKEFWSFTYTLMIFERYRLMREGLMTVQMELRIGNLNRFTITRQYFTNSAKVSLYYDNLIDQKIRQIQDLSLFPYKNWIDTSAKIYNYELDQITKRPIWKLREMSRRSALQFLRSKMEDFYYRDYENDESIPYLRPNFNRDNDPLENLLRKNYIGDIYAQYMERSLEFDKYLTDISKQNENYMIWSMVLVLGASTLILCMYVCYEFYKIGQMKEFYRTLFYVKIDEIIEEIDLRNSIYEGLKQVIKEEHYHQFEYHTEGNGAVKDHSIKQVDQNKIVGKTIKIGESKGKSKEDKENRSILKQEYLKIKSNDLQFGFNKIIRSFTLLLIFGMIIQVGYFLIIYPRSRKTTMLCKAYSLSVRTWSMYYYTLTVFTEIVIWNNTVETGTTRSTLEEYENSVKYIRESILLDITESLNYDLGDYSDNYSQILTQGNSCETVFKKEIHPFCSIYFNGLFNSNYYSSLKGIIEVLDNSIEKWKTKRHSWDIVHDILREKSLQAYWNVIFPIMTDIYRVLSIPLLNELFKTLDSNIQFLSLYNNFMIGGLFLVYLVLSIIMYSRSQQLMVNYYGHIYIIPFELLEKNSIIKHHMQKIGGNGPFFKLRTHIL